MVWLLGDLVIFGEGGREGTDSRVRQPVNLVVP